MDKLVPKFSMRLALDTYQAIKRHEEAHEEAMDVLTKTLHEITSTFDEEEMQQYLEGIARGDDYGLL